MIGKGRCDKGFIWNPLNCECECDKSCGIGQYSDYKNCKCRKELVSKLVEECSEDTNVNEIIYNEILNDYGNVCNSCTVFIVLFVTAFLVIISISVSIFFSSILEKSWH